MSNCKDKISSDAVNLLNRTELQTLINNCNSCNSLPRLIPAEWRNLLTINIRYHIENPSGIWADFNPIYNGWLTLINWANEGILCYDELPQAPNPDDYIDYDSIKTVDLPNISKMKNMPNVEPYWGGETGIKFFSSSSSSKSSSSKSSSSSSRSSRSSYSSISSSRSSSLSSFSSSSSSSSNSSSSSRSSSSISSSITPTPEISSSSISSSSSS